MLARLVTVLIVVLVLAGCGGDGGDPAREQARVDYHQYRTAEDARTVAEGRLRKAVSAIAAAAGEHDRGGVFSAATRGQIAARDIRRLLDRELAAATAIAGYEPTAAHGERLAEGLRTTRRGLNAVEQELEIAHRDPFLDRPENSAAISRLAREVVALSKESEFAIRRADRAIALELGIEPRPDPLLDRPGAGD